MHSRGGHEFYLQMVFNSADELSPHKVMRWQPLSEQDEKNEESACTQSLLRLSAFIVDYLHRL
jgi:hypothetical protein